MISITIRYFSTWFHIVLAAKLLLLWDTTSHAFYSASSPFLLSHSTPAPSVASPSFPSLYRHFLSELLLPLWLAKHTERVQTNRWKLLTTTVPWPLELKWPGIWSTGPTCVVRRNSLISVAMSDSSTKIPTSKSLVTMIKKMNCSIVGVRLWWQKVAGTCARVTAAATIMM